MITTCHTTGLICHLVEYKFIEIKYNINPIQIQSAAAVHKQFLSVDKMIKIELVMFILPLTGKKGRVSVELV